MSGVRPTKAKAPTGTSSASLKDPVAADHEAQVARKEHDGLFPCDSSEERCMNLADVLGLLD